MDHFDISFKDVPPPVNNWCSSGHTAAETFKRGGADTEPEPTKFYSVSGKGVSGIYCEPCLIVAQYAARQVRKNKGK